MLRTWVKLPHSFAKKLIYINYVGNYGVRSKQTTHNRPFKIDHVRYRPFHNRPIHIRPRS